MNLQEMKKLSPEDQKELFERISSARSKGKTSNYALVYGSGAETLARSGEMPVADAKKLHKAYWEVHWYVKAIAEEQFTFACSEGHRWLINPINGFPYSVRSDKDIFSTLIQGTGSYFFDIWVDNVVEEMYKRWGQAMLNLLYHDELAFSFKDLQKLRDIMSKIVYEAIDKVNQEFKLRIDLGCDVCFGDSYAEIH